MDRRGFLKLAGLATAAVTLAKTAILPAHAQPHPDWDDAADRLGMVSNRIQVEAGLIVEGTTEVEYVGYVRVVPKITIKEGVARGMVVFPTVRRGGCQVRRVGLYDRKTGDLLFWQDFSDQVTLNAGNTLQANLEIRLNEGFGGGLTDTAMMRLLGVSDGHRG